VRRRRRPASPWRRAGQWTVAALVGLVGGLLGRLPVRAGQGFGAGLGRVAYWLLPGRRRVALDNLALVYGDTLSPGARATLARRCFEHLGTTVMECCRLFFGPREHLFGRVQGRGMEHIGRAMAQGRGIFFLTGHFGNWELLAATHGLAGFGLSVVVRPLDNPYLDALIARARERSGLRAISKRDGPCARPACGSSRGQRARAPRLGRRRGVFVGSGRARAGVREASGGARDAGRRRRGGARKARRGRRP